MAIRIKRKSFFVNPNDDSKFFWYWVRNCETQNRRIYNEIELTTSLGKTTVWAVNPDTETSDVLVIFPAERTSSLFWDFDRGLDSIDCPLKIYLVETNGLPNLSEGSSPDIRTLDYGVWASEVLTKLKIDKAFIAGASFGGSICMKLCVVSPEKVRAAFLLNPACLQFFSLRLRNLYFNLLPRISISESSLRSFFDNVMFYKPTHFISEEAEKLLIEYEELILIFFKDNFPRPYCIENRLRDVTTDTYLMVSNKDMLFPFRRSIANAMRKIKPLKEVKVFQNVGHSLETYSGAMHYIGWVIKRYAS